MDISKSASGKKSFIVGFICLRSHASLAVSHLFQSRPIRSPYTGDLRGCGVELAKIVRGEFDSDRSDVLFKTLQPGGAGNGNDPGLLCQEPGECDLSQSRILLGGEARNQIHKA